MTKAKNSDIIVNCIIIARIMGYALRAGFLISNKEHKNGLEKCEMISIFHVRINIEWSD